MKPHPNSKKEEETRFWRFFIGSGAVRQVVFLKKLREIVDWEYFTKRLIKLYRDEPEFALTYLTNLFVLNK